eukprot:TRINITY_DN3805_c0_g1_i2.p2 TRINITY_DN3805_c0_g1~~TRINITY_DN3805_c0_g1_i2.p2  ORF type:complete len:88 (+),score=11.89 TRINITY_DN3805_c0_g1_i2:178-441(+)
MGHVFLIPGVPYHSVIHNTLEQLNKTTRTRYRWQPIVGTLFTLVLAIDTSFTQIEIPLAPEEFLLEEYFYHEFDVVAPPGGYVTRFI